MPSPHDNRHSPFELPEHTGPRETGNTIRLVDHMVSGGPHRAATAAAGAYADADSRDGVVTPFRPGLARHLPGDGSGAGDGWKIGKRTRAVRDATGLQVTGFSLPQVLLLSVAMSLLLIATVVALASALFIFGGMA